MSTRRDRAIEEVRRWSSVILIVLVIVVGLQVSSLGGSVDRIERSSSRTEAAASELVAFVHEIQAQQTQASSNGGQSQIVQMLVDLLCASSDPVRVQACAALTQPGG